MQRGTVAVVAAATLATVAYIAASQEENAPVQINTIAKPEQEQERDGYDEDYDYEDYDYEDYEDEQDQEDYYGRRHR